MTAVIPDIDVLAGLDFAPTLPCEHSQHLSNHIADEPATWEVRLRCPECKAESHYLSCESGMQRLLHLTIGCRRCGAYGDWDKFGIYHHRIPEL